METRVRRPWGHGAASQSPQLGNSSATCPQHHAPTQSPPNGLLPTLFFFCLLAPTPHPFLLSVVCAVIVTTSYQTSCLEPLQWFPKKAFSLFVGLSLTPYPPNLLEFRGVSVTRRPREADRLSSAAAPRTGQRHVQGHGMVALVLFLWLRHAPPAISPSCDGSEVSRASRALCPRSRGAATI